MPRFGRQRRSIIAAAIACGWIVSASKSASAGVGVGAAAFGPSVVQVGGTVEAVVLITNASDGAEAAGPLLLSGIRVIPACAGDDFPCRGFDQEPFVFAISPTARGVSVGATDQACDGLIFDVILLDFESGEVLFQLQSGTGFPELQPPGTPGEQCRISFSMEVLNFPFNDASPIFPGVQTNQLIRVTGASVITELTFTATGSSQLTVIAPTPSPTASPTLTGMATATPTLTPTRTNTRPPPTPTFTMDTATPTATPTPTPKPERFCAGDCDGDGEVTAEEVEACARLPFDFEQSGVCPPVDTDGNGEVRSAELVECIDAAINGCPPIPPGRPEIAIGRASGEEGTGVDVDLVLDANGLEVLTIAPLLIDFDPRQLSIDQCVSTQSGKAAYAAEPVAGQLRFVLTGDVAPIGEQFARCTFTIRPDAQRGATPLRFISGIGANSELRLLPLVGARGWVTVE